MTERHKSDYALQAAALRHYAAMCWEKYRGMRPNTEGEKTAAAQFIADATRAEVLAKTYERLAGL